MNFKTITALVVQAFSQRNVNVDLDTAVGALADLTPDIAGQLVNLGRLELQREHDFNAMDTPLTGQVYATGGLAIGATVKRPYAVYCQGTGGASQAIRGKPIWPANKQDVLRIGLEHHSIGASGSNWGGWNGWAGYRFPGGSSALDMDPGGTVWWIKGNKIILGSAGCSGDDSGFNGQTLWVDTFSYLIDYAAAADSDWFSVWGSDVLIYKACILACGVGQREERVDYFEGLLNNPGPNGRPSKLGALYALDEEVTAGGQSDLIIAPTRGYSMRR